MADGYTVESTSERTVMGPGGGMTKVVEVYFRTTGGARGSVQVPRDAATAAEVARRIAAYAENLDAIHNL